MSNLTIMPALAAPYATTLRSKDPLREQSIQGRWTHRYLTSDELSVQSYWDHVDFNVASLMNLGYHVFDLELVNRLRLGSFQEWFPARRRDRPPIGRAPRPVPGRARSAGRDLDSGERFAEDEISLWQRRLVPPSGPNSSTTS